MSYCRFSSDDFQCDCYCYGESIGGYVIHVAGRRAIFKDPLPPPIMLDKDNTQEWWARHKKVSKMLEKAELRPLGLPHDGQTLHADTPGEAADTLEMLRKEGYRIRQYAIDELRKEEQEVSRLHRESDTNGQPPA